MLLSLTIAVAGASPGYPTAMVDLTGAVCAPTCTVCHETEAGGGGTVVQDFGVALVARGLVGGSNTDALATSLMALDEDEVDSDGDGALDVDEVADGVDPNPGGVPLCDVVTPTYGCLSHAGGPPAPFAVALVLLALGRRRYRSSVGGR